jgi:hypothetical protein
LDFLSFLLSYFLPLCSSSSLCSSRCLGYCRRESGSSDASESDEELSGDSGVLRICFPLVFVAEEEGEFLRFFPKKRKPKTKTYRRRRCCTCLGDAAVCCDCGEGKRRREEPGSVVVPTSMCRVCARSLCLRLFDRSVGNAVKYEKFAGIACLCVCVSCLIGNLSVSNSFPSIICLFWRCVTCC